MPLKRKHASGIAQTKRRVAKRTRRSDFRWSEWNAFATSLATALNTLPEDHFLILVVKGRHRFVQFATGGSQGIRAECVSNQYLEAGERLTRQDHRALSALGWNRPDKKAVGSGTVGGKAGGSSNWYKDFDQPVDYEALSALAVATFASVYGVDDPGQLAYKAFHSAGGRVVLPGLGIPVEQGAGTAQIPERSLTQKVCDAAAAASEEPPQRVSDNTWLVSVAGVGQILVVLEQLSLARVIIPIGAADEMTIDLAKGMNQINAEVVQFGYVYWRNRELRYAAEFLLQPFAVRQVRDVLERAAVNRRLVDAYLYSRGARKPETESNWQLHDPSALGLTTWPEPVDEATDRRTGVGDRKRKPPRRRSIR